jgi:hypothetical protein
MKLNFKSTLLTGSAIVAVGALMGAGQHARALHAADAADSNSNNNIYNGTNRGCRMLLVLLIQQALPGATVFSLLAQRRNRPSP